MYLFGLYDLLKVYRRTHVPKYKPYLSISISRTSKITTKYQISADREKNKKTKLHLDPNPRAPQSGPKQK